MQKKVTKKLHYFGQNVNSYKGRENYGFADLLRDVQKIDGIEIIKFISPHPKDFTDDVIQAIKDCDKVSRILHLPLQSGSTEVLRKMNRKYTKEQYLELVRKIRKKIPDVLFSTDIIVGFPEETEADFEETLDVVSKVNFEQIFMFIYSRRVGTPADKNVNQIPEEIKHKRFDRLKALFESQVEENNKKYIGTIQKILVEERKVFRSRSEQRFAGRGFSQRIGAVVARFRRWRLVDDFAVDGGAFVFVKCPAFVGVEDKGVIVRNAADQRLFHFFQQIFRTVAVAVVEVFDFPAESVADFFRKRRPARVGVGDKTGKYGNVFSAFFRRRRISHLVGRNGVDDFVKLCVFRFHRRIFGLFWYCCYILCFFV